MIEVSGLLIGISWLIFLLLLIVFFALSNESVRLRLSEGILLGTWDQPGAAETLQVQHEVFLYGMPALSQSLTEDGLFHLHSEAISRAILWRSSASWLTFTWRGLPATARLLVFAQLPLWGTYLLIGLVQLASDTANTLTGAQYALDAFWLLGLLLLPAFFLVWRPPCRFGLSAINDTAAVLCAWLPLEFDWVPKHVVAALSHNDSLPLVEVVCLINAIVLFTVVRPTGLNASFSFRAFCFADSYERAYAACAVFFVLGMPLCLVTSFIEWQPSSATVLEFAGLYVLIYFGTAIIEEILFRAVIQSIIEDHVELHWPHLAHSDNVHSSSNSTSTAEQDDNDDGDVVVTSMRTTAPHRVLEPWRPRRANTEADAQRGALQRFGSWLAISRSAAVALVFASIIFGLAHLDNDTPNYHSPNFLYAMFAAFAGALYGWVYRTTGFLTASAITHATVDWMWSVFFH